ncbi:MAG: hypothetical protein WA821_02040 [Anaerolineales bacterium]
MKRIFPVINAVVAIAAGVIVLLGYFITSVPALTGFRALLLQWSVLLAGMAVLVGVGNLFSVHLQKITARKPGALYSVVLLVFFLLTFLVVIAVNFAPSMQDSPIFADLQKIFLNLQNIFLNGIMVPVEISLMALLTVTLLYSTVRLLRWRIDLKTSLFLVTALLVLISTGPLTAQLPLMDGIGGFIQILSTGGARGILIGVALGTLTTGLRILFGADRPYGGK